jgi:predicted cupin superfamily sugar epimerase
MTGSREVIDWLGMEPHREGGWYVETWRAETTDARGRSVASAILYLLNAGEQSHWHRVDAAEIWQSSGGDALELRIAVSAAGPIETHVLSSRVEAGHWPQVIVPSGAWQAARPLGEWALVGCIVAPAFEFEGFELAPEGWEPGAMRDSGSDPRPRSEPSR